MWAVGVQKAECKVSMKRNYRIYELDYSSFEKLCSRICVNVLGEGFVNFASGKDGGRDGIFNGTAKDLPSSAAPLSGKFVMQAKYTARANASCSEGQFFKTILDKEISKIKRLVDSDELEHYFILTNRTLSAGHEKKIKDKIQSAVPSLSSVTIWGMEKLHLHLDSHRELHEEFGFDQPRTPLNVFPEDLERVISKFRDFIPVKSPEDKGKNKKDFLYVNIDKKNEINGLSDEYCKYIKEDSEKHFQRIMDFLKDPKHGRSEILYSDTALDFKGMIINRRGDFNTFDDVLETIYQESYSKLQQKGVAKRLLKVFIHFIYFNCDIGKKE